MKITVASIGAGQTVEVDESQFFDFGDGLGGFEELRRYALIPEPDSPLEWLQSVDDPAVAFPLLEPFLFYPQYSFELSDADVRALRLEGPEEAVVRCVLTVGERPEDTTANLIAPLVLNRRVRLGRQLVLQDRNLSLRFAVFQATKLAAAS